MAAAAQELRYRGYSVDGNLARDMDWEVREHELRHAGEARRYREEERRQAAAAPKVRPAERVKVRARQHVSVVTVAGFGAVIVMAVMMLMSYIQLTVISADTVALKSELAALDSEHVTLTAQYEQMFDIATVKEVAAAAGMAKPGTSQVCYLDLSGADSAVVYQYEDPSVLSHVLSSLHHGIYSVVEYFD